MYRLEIDPTTVKVLEPTVDRFQRSAAVLAGAPIEKQEDLLYCSALLVSEGENKNKDYFLRNMLIQGRKSPIHKHVNLQHHPQFPGGTFKGKQIGICGHIYDSCLMLEKGDQQIYVDESQIIEKEINGKKVYDINIPDADTYRLHIVVSFIVYQFEYPELAEEILKSVKAQVPVEMSVSMEVLFTDYKFRAGDISPFETFGQTPKDAVDIYASDSRAPMLENLRRAGKKWQGKSLVRVIGGVNFFSGMGLVFFPANQFSEILSAANTKENLVRKCYPMMDEAGSVKMRCVLQAVASLREQNQIPEEKQFFDTLAQDLKLFREEGSILASVKKDETTDFTKLTLLLYGSQAAPAGILFIVGFPKDGKGSKVQSILFNKRIWTEEEARGWLTKHGYHADKIDVTDQNLRFRQLDPGQFKRFVTVRPGAKASLLELAKAWIDELMELNR